MPNVFLTGVSAVNLALIKKLLSNGYKTTVLVQNKESMELAKTVGAIPVAGDLIRPETYVQLLKEADIVLHSPNIFDLGAGPLESVAVETITSVLKDTHKTFIYTSHTWVLGSANNILADEKTPVAPISLVAPLAHFEKKVLQAAHTGIRSIVVRLANVYGYKGDFVETYIKRTVREKTAHFAGDGYNSLSIIALEDLLDLYLVAIDKGVAGAIYHGANGKPVSGKNFAELVGRIVGVPETIGLSHAELKVSYGALAEAYSLNQKISFKHTKEELNWVPEHLDLKPYIEQAEMNLSAGLLALS
ncbi:MAG: NAD-dependent epimerase/dehydratase family protein [Candidatus Obscuribacterales bacterium]|nr:NAD-dependent epimerase/dehydratase family protein [Candidatus Obscuribacterales bacterium]